MRSEKKDFLAERGESFTDIFWDKISFMFEPNFILLMLKSLSKIGFDMNRVFEFLLASSRSSTSLSSTVHPNFKSTSVFKTTTTNFPFN